jgi:hypothetical protein
MIRLEGRSRFGVDSLRSRGSAATVMLAYRDRFGARSSLNLVVGRVELAISRVRSAGISTSTMMVSASILLTKKGRCSGRSSLGIGECSSRSSSGVGELASRSPSALASRARC